MTLLLDSHVILWWLAGSRFLSRRARVAVGGASRLLVSPISCWEIAVLSTRGRVRLASGPHAWVQSLYEIEHVQSAPLTPAAAVSAALLDRGSFPGDPADRMLYATAKDLGVPFVTGDHSIHEYARGARDVRVVW